MKKLYFGIESVRTQNEEYKKIVRQNQVVNEERKLVVLVSIIEKSYTSEKLKDTLKLVAEVFLGFWKNINIIYT